MKPFTIRKAVAAQPSRQGMMDATGEMSSSKYATGGDRMQSSMMSGAGGFSQADGMQQEHTNLTEEELEALKPQEIRVVNPWIHEHTHKEYLENITGLPARHANLIKKHKTVVKETTFLPKDDEEQKIREKDIATKEAVAILEKEYEIFRDPKMPGVKVLTRYDTWE
jgi:hypothetical protein